MTEPFEVTAGWTGELGPFTLKANGNPYDVTGKTVTLQLRKAEDGVVVTAGGAIRPGSNTGEVYYAPTGTEFAAASGIRPQILNARWKVVDSGGKIVYFPNGKADTFFVWPA